MLVWIVANQRLYPIRPENGEHSETTAEGGERSDQSKSGDGRLIAGVAAARLRVSLRVGIVVGTLLLDGHKSL